MAQDKKITQLDVLTQAAAADVFAIVDQDVGPTTKQISAQNLFASPQPIGSSNASTGVFTTLGLLSGATIYEFSIDSTLAGDSDAAVPTEKAVKGYVDTSIANLSANSISEGDSSVVVSDTTASAFVEVTVNSTSVATYTDTGLQLSSGATINEFSTDVTLSGDSDTAVPTEKAVKAYVDAAISGASPYKIWQGDSSVVVSDTTETPNIEVTVDSTSVATFWSNGLQLSTGSIINEFSNDILLSGDSTSVVPTEYAVKNYVDNYIPDKIQDGDVFVQVIDGTASNIVLEVDQLLAATITEDGLRLETGARVDEFSTDGTLADDSDSAVPTEKAVKTYVDSQIGSVSHINVSTTYSDSTAINGDAILVDTTAGSVNITLIASLDSKIIIKKITSDSNVVNVTVLGGLIDSQSSTVIDTTNYSMTFISDGTNYYVV